MSDWLDLTQEQRLWTLSNDNLEIADSPEEITCPWCNEKQNFDYVDVSYEDDYHGDYECVECGKTFTVQTCVTYDWRTRLPEDYLIEQAKKAWPVTTPIGGDQEGEDG